MHIRNRDTKWREIIDDLDDLANEADRLGSNDPALQNAIDGELYPPMAENVRTQVIDKNGKVKKVQKKNSPSVQGMWGQSNEDPDHARKKVKKDGTISWEYELLKIAPQTGETSPCWAAYNPYTHSSNTVLNDQFSIAYRRPNLVVYECRIPVCELNDPYHAEKSLNHTGWKDWKTGTVATQIAKQKEGFRRRVMLSRFCMPYRVLRILMPDGSRSDFNENMDASKSQGHTQQSAHAGQKASIHDNDITQEYVNDNGESGISDANRSSLRPSAELTDNIGTSAEMLVKMDTSLLTSEAERNASVIHRSRSSRVYCMIWG